MTEEAVQDASVPLELATQGQLLAELERRYTNYVLVVDQPGHRGDTVVNGVFWWGTPASGLGLLEYARVTLILELYQQARGEYHGAEEE